MKARYFLLFGLMIALFSCTKLDEKVYDKIPGTLYPENADQIANLSVEAYTKLRPMADDEGWWFLAQEISGDGLCGPTRGSDWEDGGKWTNMYLHEWSNDDEGVNRMWSAFWTGITTCNQILDMMNELPSTPALTAKKKEVEVLRSFYYYLLIDNYGDTPYLTSAKNAPDKPFKIKRAAIYDSIVATVTNALGSLKEADIKYMVNKNMAHALLTKLYLNAEIYKGTANWDSASRYCDLVLAGPYALESNLLTPFITNNEKSKEIIFSIPYDENTFQGFRLHMRTLHYQHNLRFDMPVGPWNGFCCTPPFFESLEEGDKRKEGYLIFGQQYDVSGNEILDGETKLPLNIDYKIPALKMDAANYTPTQIRTTGARVGKYEIKIGAKENLSNDFPLFRLTDFYLIKAELEIRKGGNGDEWITPIRNRAGVDPKSGWTLEQLLAERGKELFCEGHRRQDLIRFGKFGEKKWEKPTPDAAGKTTFPIPKWATDANPNLLINP